MNKRAEYYLNADFCNKMADRSVDFEAKSKWLELAGKWLLLAGDGGTPNDQFEAAVRDLGTGQERSRSTN